MAICLHPYSSKLVSCPDPFKKDSGNMAIGLVQKEFNQSQNHMLMFIYEIKIEGVHSYMACVIESFSKY